MERRRSRFALGVVLSLAALVLSGCWASYQTAVIPPPGFIYSDVSAPLMTPGLDTGISDISDVEVYTTQIQVPFIYGGAISAAWDESSITAAVDASGFDEVVYADYHWFSVLSVYNKFTVNVYGRR